MNSCWLLFRWGLGLVIVAALAAGGYLYLHLDDEIRRQVEQRLSAHYQNLKVHVGSAQFEQERGITIRDIRFDDPQTGASREPLLSIDELFLAGNIRLDELVSGSLPIREIVVRGPKLNAERGANGQWNVKPLLPMPKFSEHAPLMSIEGGTLSLHDAAHPSIAPLVLSGVNAKLAPQPVAGNSADSSCKYQIAGTADGLPARELRFDGELSTTDGAVDITIGIRGLEVSQELLARVPAALPAAFSEYRLSGKVDAAVRVTRTAGPAGQIDWSTQLKLEQGRLQHARFPDPLTDLTFQVQADRNLLAVRQLNAKWRAANITLACNRYGWTDEASLGLAMRVDGFKLDRTLVGSLPEKFARIWSRFEPTGMIDANLELTYDGKEWRPNLKAACRNASLTDTEKFPYRIDQAAGRVEYTAANRGAADKLVIDLQGTGGGRPVSVQVELTHLTSPPPDDRPSRTGVAIAPTITLGVQAVGYRGAPVSSTQQASGARPIGWVVVSGTDIPLNDAALLAAISQRSPQGGKLIESLRPQGAVDFRWRGEWRDRLQSRAETSLDLTLKDCSILFDRFQYPLRHVNGRVTERDRQWEIHDVQARGANDATTVICRGSASPSADGSLVTLDFHATNMPLDTNLKQALPPGAQRAWDEIRPTGNIDFTAHVVHEPGQETAAIDVEIKPRERTVSIEPRQFPYRFAEVSGVARYADGRVDIRDFSGRHGRSLYSARECVWQGNSSGVWQFTLKGGNADHLELDQELFSALPPGLQQVMARLQPRGAFALYESTISFEKRPDAVRLTSEWDVNLDCHQVTLGGGLPLANITGGIRFMGRSDEKGPRTAGELAIHSMTFKDLQFTSVRGPIWADPSVCLFGQSAAGPQNQTPRPITADAYGGSLTANIRINHETTPTFRAEFALGGADLARFATERLGGPKDLTGTVSGKLAIEGIGNSMQTLIGGGDLHVVNANIYELPVLVSTLNVLKNRSPNTTAFNRCDMQFRVQGDKVLFEQLQLLGDAVSLYGRGEAAFDRQINMVFHGLAGPADLPIPLWSTIARQATQQILEIKVDGTWDQPVTKVNALPTVNNMLDQIQAEFGTGGPTVATPAAARADTAPARR